MAIGGIDISMTGDRELIRAFKMLPEQSQKKVVRPAARRSIKRLHVLLIQAFSGLPVGVRSGRTLTDVASMKVRSRTRKGEVSADLDDSHLEKEGFPYMRIAIEHGTSKMRALAPVRKTVNANQARELATITTDIAKGVEKQWKKLAR